MPEQALLVFSNLPDADSARALAHMLTRQGLAACVNILPAVQSIYRWQGAIEEAVETTVLIKSSRARYAELQAAILAHHPYDVPEIIALDIAAGAPAYLQWLASETRKEGHA